MQTRQYEAIRDLAYDLTGVRIGDTRRSMLESRVGSRMRALGVGNADKYLDLVKSDQQERERFVDKITTHETYFFRTPRIWDHIDNVFLPAFYSANPDQPCRAWSAATSSGEEAYSIAMSLSNFQSRNPQFKFSVLGSDISVPIVEKCRTGTYKGRTIERLRKSRPAYLTRFFCKTNEGYQVSNALSTVTRFSVNNLFESSRNGQKFDLILCRNVLIYFSLEDQNRVLERLSSSISKDGCLIIGEAENLAHDNPWFVQEGPLIFRPRGSRPSVVAELSLGAA